MGGQEVESLSFPQVSLSLIPGAGKTLVGITAACTVKKSTIILCTNALSVQQWANELKKWSSRDHTMFIVAIQDEQIAQFTANHKERFAGILDSLFRGFWNCHFYLYHDFI
jgi:superfamily II DNA or RNA helicase